MIAAVSFMATAVGAALLCGSFIARGKYRRLLADALSTGGVGLICFGAAVCLWLVIGGAA